MSDIPPAVTTDIPQQIAPEQGFNNLVEYQSWHGDIAKLADDASKVYPFGQYSSGKEKESATTLTEIALNHGLEEYRSLQSGESITRPVDVKHAIYDCLKGFHAGTLAVQNGKSLSDENINITRQGENGQQEGMFTGYALSKLMETQTNATELGLNIKNLGGNLKIIDEIKLILKSVDPDNIKPETTTVNDRLGFLQDQLK